MEGNIISVTEMILSVMEMSAIEFSVLKQERSIPSMILSAVINFVILAIIFVLTLWFRNRALYDVGFRDEDYARDAFVTGIALALAASAILLLVDIITGGLGSVMMVGVYALTVVAALILYIASPKALRDTPDDISLYRLWSVSFWIIFIVGMVVAISLSLFTSYLSKKFTALVLELVDNIAYGNAII